MIRTKVHKTILLLLTSTATLWSMSANEVIDRVNTRNDGTSVSRTLKMVLTDKRGKKRVRETTSYRKYYGKDKKSVLFYTSPKRLDGTAFLTYDNATKADQQWLYLPAIRKVRRVSAADRGDWFLGTDFSYEDIKKETKIAKEDYTFKMLGEDNIDGNPCYKVESTAKSKDIAKELGYSKIIGWIDKKIFISRRNVFYDARGSLLKELHNTDIRKIQGIWTIGHMHMINKQNKHVSDFYFKNVNYKKSIKNSIFSKQALKKGILR